MIGRQFLFMGLIMLVLGGLLALHRALAARRGRRRAVPGLGWILEETGGILEPVDATTWLFTMHATIMIFFVIMPILVGLLRQLPASRS